MAITDLTGTTWLFNESGITSYTTIHLNFTSNNMSFTSIWPRREISLDMTYQGTNNVMVYSSMSGQSGGGWVSESYRTINITGGTDATNSAVIAWLQSNAVQQVTRNDYFTCTDELKSIADAIRTKGGTSASLTYPSGFVTAINNLPTKVLGAGTISGYDSPFDIQVTADDYSAGEWDGFSSVTVNINTPFYDGSCDIIDPVRIIEFTAYDGNMGRTYSLEAEDGMTWSQWISSEYNSDGFSSQGTAVLYPSHESAVTTSNGGSVTTSSIIIENHAYNYTLW